MATGRLSQDVLSLNAAPHGWLLPRVCAAVHHGGAGVTGAALRAGLPSVVVPIFGDQPFWGQRLFDLGAGAQPIPAARLTSGALTDALRRTAEPDMRRRANELARLIGQEDGVARAVEVIDRHLGRRPRHAGSAEAGSEAHESPARRVWLSSAGAREASERHM